MPLPQEERIALSNALIKAVRKHIFFSPNIENLWPSIYQKYKKTISRKYNTQHLPTNLESHTGKCGALSDMVCLLLKHSPMKISSEVKFMKITFYKSNNKDNHSFVVLHDGSQHIPRGKTNDEKKNGLKKNIDQTSSGKTALRIFKNKIFYELNKIIDDKIDTDKDLLAFAEIDDFHDLYHNENKIFFYTQAENLIKRY